MHANIYRNPSLKKFKDQHLYPIKTLQSCTELSTKALRMGASLLEYLSSACSTYFEEDINHSERLQWQAWRIGTGFQLRIYEQRLLLQQASRPSRCLELFAEKLNLSVIGFFHKSLNQDRVGIHPNSPFILPCFAALMAFMQNRLPADIAVAESVTIFRKTRDEHDLHTPPSPLSPTCKRIDDASSVLLACRSIKAILAFYWINKSCSFMHSADHYIPYSIYKRVWEQRAICL